MSLNQRYGYAFGFIYLVVGLVGFLITGFGQFAGSNVEKHLIFFEINPLHNVVHMVIGVLLIAGAGAGFKRSKNVNALVGAVYLLVGIFGLVLLAGDPDSPLNILSLNHPDNGLHFATAILAFAVAFTEKTPITE